MDAGFKTVEYVDGTVRLLDQRRLPSDEVYVNLTHVEGVAEAIRGMVVRGAPAIGITAAFGVALAARRLREGGRDNVEKEVERACALLGATRPTAVNLFWALDRMREVVSRNPDLARADLVSALEAEAARILEEDIAANRAMGGHGQELIPDVASVLTHCNAGALATGGFGTALGVIRAARECGKRVRVYADETRPFLQGARLTAWELAKEGIPVVLITDSMAGSLMRKGEIHVVVVGADRIAANGDVANKIGTYPLAVLSQAHAVPFYVAAPLSTIDLTIPTGDDIPIEMRDPAEVIHCGGSRVAPEGVEVLNPAFDVTPHTLVAAIITERGIARPPYTETLPRLHKP